MKKSSPSFHFTVDVLLYPLALVLLMWVVFWVEIRFGVRLNRYGILPQQISGLRGIVFGPFVHGSLQHLFNNSVPMLVLGMALFYFYSNIRWSVLLYGTLLTGLLTWFIGREAYHIGASGVVYMLVAFLFFKGLLSRHYRLVALSMVVVFLYGGLWWYVMPVDPQISWEGHLSGFVIGTLFAFLFRHKIALSKPYQWEQENYDSDSDPFMQAFDADGNFVGTPPPADETPDTMDHTGEGYRVGYTFREKKSRSE